MLQPFISLPAFKIPHQIPTLNLKLLYDTHESELTICTKTRLQENLLPLQFFQCFILDLRKDSVRPGEGWATQTFESQPQPFWS